MQWNKIVWMYKPIALAGYDNTNACVLDNVKNMMNTIIPIFNPTRTNCLLLLAIFMKYDCSEIQLLI